MTRTLARDDGMTLVELLVAMAISTMLLVGISAIFTQGLKSQQEQAARDKLTGEISGISTYFNESMRNSVMARVSESNRRIDMSVMKEQGMATIECRSFLIHDNKLWYNYGPGKRGNFNARTWTVLADGLVAPVPGGDPSGFVEDGGAYTYNLTLQSGGVEVSVSDGGYPRGQARQYWGAECW